MFLQRNSHQIFDFYHCISKSLYFSLIFGGCLLLVCLLSCYYWFWFCKWAYLQLDFKNRQVSLSYHFFHLDGHLSYVWSHIYTAFLLRLKSILTLYWKQGGMRKCLYSFLSPGNTARVCIALSYPTLGDPVDCSPPCVSYIGRRIFLPLASPHLLTVNIFTWPNKRLLFACYSLIF